MIKREINLNKVKYTSRSHAKKAIKEHKDKYNQDMRHYKCRCDGTKHYHLTSQTQVRAVIMRAGEIIEKIV